MAKRQRTDDHTTSTAEGKEEVKKGAADSIKAESFEPIRVADLGQYISLAEYSASTRDDFTCAVCTYPLWNPVLRACCTRMVCLHCFEATPSHDTKCVMCKKAVTSSNPLVPLQHLSRSVLDARSITCPTQCGITGLVVESILRHLTYSCSRGKVCECNVIFPSSQFASHHSTCGKVRTRCDLCGTTSIIRENMSSHIETVCPEAIVPCHDCGHNIRRSKVTDHQASCLVRVLRASLEKKEKEINELKTMVIHPDCMKTNPLPLPLHVTMWDLKTHDFTYLSLVGSKDTCFLSLPWRILNESSNNMQRCDISYSERYKLVAFTSIVDRIFLRYGPDFKVIVADHGTQRWITFKQDKYMIEGNSIMFATRGWCQDDEGKEYPYRLVYSTAPYLGIVFVIEGPKKTQSAERLRTLLTLLLARAPLVMT